jgi:hypothetical protein
MTKKILNRMVARIPETRGCHQKFPDWPPGARTGNGKALCH